ncbi:MAG: type III secretion system cytoplasmic ring protein SctQ [Chlamydiia bacterium]|nr:type III secretion system cytoplasmic ring protein SctQ [Chlamydiia bacterium]
MRASALSFLTRKLAPELAETRMIPLFGRAPAFDWQHYATLIQERLQLGDFSIELGEQRMCENNEILTGLGDHPAILPIVLSPLVTPIFWIVPRAEIVRIGAALLMKKAKASPFTSEVLEEGYYRYLVLEALDEAKNLEPLNQLSVQLSDVKEMPEESAFCIDVTFSASSFGTCNGRLVLPLSMQKAFIRHFSHLPYAPIAPNRAKEVELTVGMRLGSIQIDPKEWAQIQIGDALYLDRVSFDPRKKEAVVTIQLGSIPVFQARVESNRLTILEYAFYHEDTMEGQNIPESPVQTESSEEVVAIQNYPISIAVELGRLRITLEQLMRLSAGNTLELPIQPDQTVALTVNGRLVGRGELVSFGDETVAVRVLEIAT